MLIHTFTLTNQFQVDNLRPIMFNSTDIVMPNGYDNGIFSDIDLFEKAIIILASTSFKVLNDFGSGPQFFRSN